jgi:hypothetical protein
MSKPGLEITEQVIEEIKEMAGNGLTEQQIYRYYGIGHAYWNRLKKQNKELRRAFYQGKSQTIKYVSGCLMDRIRAGDTVCMMFYLKTQAGWREKTTVNIKGDVKSKNQVLKIEATDPIEASKIYQRIMTGS